MASVRAGDRIAGSGPESALPPAAAARSLFAVSRGELGGRFFDRFGGRDWGSFRNGFCRLCDRLGFLASARLLRRFGFGLGGDFSRGGFGSGSFGGSGFGHTVAIDYGLLARAADALGGSGRSNCPVRHRPVRHRNFASCGLRLGHLARAAAALWLFGLGCFAREFGLGLGLI